MKNLAQKYDMFSPRYSGTNIYHKTDFVIDRPRDPYETCLIFSFRSSGIILTANGIEQASPGDCIIHAVDFYQYHTSAPNAVEGYRNDFLHVPPGIIEPVMATIGLPYNVLISTAQPEILTSFIKEVQFEFSENHPFSEMMITNIIEKMLLQVARANNIFMNKRTTSSQIELIYLEKFTALKKKLYRNYDKQFSVKDLAREVNISPERFAVLYKKFFGKSPYNELIDIRFQEAKRLLLNSKLEIKEVARYCGWHDQHYFSRIFKKKLGISPREFRKKVPVH